MYESEHLELRPITLIRAIVHMFSFPRIDNLDLTIC